MKNGRWQAKDIDDRFFLACVEWAGRQESLPPYAATKWDHFPHWVFTWNLERLIPMLPPEVILAKARALLKRGLLDGCGCGCRGNFELTDQGRAFLKRWQAAS